MLKTFEPDSWDFGTKIAEVVKFSSRGLIGKDFSVLEKRASANFAHQIKAADIDPGQVAVHLIGLGATEKYGCFAAGTDISLTDGRYIPIEHIMVGDEVMTDRGRSQPVIHKFERQSPDGVCVDVVGLPDELRCSTDHPFKIARFEQFGCYHDASRKCFPTTQGKQIVCGVTKNIRPCVVAPFRAIVTEWAPAITLRVNDFLVCDLPTTTPPRHISVNEAYLIGAWIADGSFIRHKLKSGEIVVTGLKFRAGKNEKPFAEKIVSCAEAVNGRVKLYDERITASTWTVIVTKVVDLARRWEVEFGGYSHTKKLPSWICNLSRQAKLALLAGYLDGDGCYVATDQVNQVTSTTVSRSLAFGLQRLCWSLGFPATIRQSGLEKHFIDERTDKYCHHRAHYTVAYATNYMLELEQHSFGKFKTREMKRLSQIHGFYHENKYYLKVRTVKSIDTPFTVYNMEVDEDHTYVGPNVTSHNCNRNADAFNEEMLKACHHTFVKYARHYRHHANKNPAKSYGLIKASSYNSDMSRVELLILLNATKEAAARFGGLVADKELEKLSSGRDLPVSMAIKVPYDECSICGHRAKSRAEYCKSAEEGGNCQLFGCKNGLAKVAHDGRMQFVHNPPGTFIDISTVIKPADRIAYGNKADYFQKAASANQILGGAALAEAYSVVPPLSYLADITSDSKALEQIKLAYILASLEDEFEKGSNRRTLQEGARAYSSDIQSDFDLLPLLKAGSDSVSTGLAALAQYKIALPLRDYIKLLFHDRPVKQAELLSSTASRLPGVYNRLLGSDDLEGEIKQNLFKPASYSSRFLKKWASDLAEAFSLDNDYVMQRIYRSAIRGCKLPTIADTSVKTASDNSLPEKLARQYALYKLAFLSTLTNPIEVPLTAKQVIVQHMTI